MSRSVLLAFIKLARMNGYLAISSGQRAADLVYLGNCQKLGVAAACLIKQPRSYEVKLRAFGERLTDSARDRIYELLIAASLPGSMVRASNAIVLVSRLPLSQGVELTWPVVQKLAEPGGHEAGGAREHARCEGRKCADGSIQIYRGGSTRRRAA